MKNVKFLKVLSCVSAVALAGCEAIYGEIPEGPFGAHPLIEEESFEKIDLVAVLTGGETSLMDGTLDQKRKSLEGAFKTFSEAIEGRNLLDGKKRMRNRVQERILAASNQACGTYKHRLKQLDASVNFLLGSLTTGLAGAGAIFTRVNVVRALSGIAGITSGVRSEFNEDFFHNLTIQVITDGLESKRREIYTEILKDRKKSPTEYPVQRAIKDAIFYHDNCSLIAGLEQAALSIERAENPGLKQLNRTLDTLQTTQTKLDKIAGVVDKTPILLLAAYLKAKDAKNTLVEMQTALTETKKGLSKKLTDPDPVTDEYNELVKGIADAKKGPEKLLKNIEKLIRASKQLFLEPDKRNYIKGLEEDWPAKLAAVQVAPRGAKLEKAKADLLLQRANAMAVRESYDDLRQEYEEEALAADDLIQTIKQLVKKAKKFLPKNAQPTLPMNKGLTLSKGKTALIGKDKLEVTDTDNKPAELTYTVTVGPINGELHLNAKALAKDGTGKFTQDDINNKRLSYKHTGPGQTEDEFSFKVSDGKGGEIAETTFKITIDAVQPLVVDPQSIVAKATIPQDSKITARGGKPTYKAAFVGQTLPPEDSIKITVNHNDVDSEGKVRSAEILLEFTDKTVAGGYKLRVSDSSTAEEGGPKTADIQITVEKKGEEEEPKFFIKKKGEEAKEINSVLDKDKIRKLQRQFGLPLDKANEDPEYGYADGVFGPKTYAAINAIFDALGETPLTNNTVPEEVVEELLERERGVLGQGRNIFERILTAEDLTTLRVLVSAPENATTIEDMRESLKAYQGTKGRPKTGVLGADDFREIIHDAG